MSSYRGFDREMRRPGAAVAPGRLRISGNHGVGDGELIGGLEPEAASLLRIQVGHVHRSPLQLQPAGQVHGGGGLPYAPLSVQKCDQQSLSY